MKCCCCCWNYRSHLYSIVLLYCTIVPMVILFLSNNYILYMFESVPDLQVSVTNLFLFPYIFTSFSRIVFSLNFRGGSDTKSAVYCLTKTILKLSINITNARTNKQIPVEFFDSIILLFGFFFCQNNNYIWLINYKAV